jgi:hypothetical protein
MRPEVRMAAGIEASMITSDGTCRLVMPLSELTIRQPRTALVDGLDVGLDRGALGVGKRLQLGVQVPRPSLGLTPRALEGRRVLPRKRPRRTPRRRART